jgi:hypothetical protein
LICRDSDSKRFLAFAEPLDLDKFHKSYSEQQEEAAKTIDLIADFCSTDFPDFCYRDSSGEYHHCNSDCPTNSPKLSGTGAMIRYVGLKPRLSFLATSAIHPVQALKIYSMA